MNDDYRDYRERRSREMTRSAFRRTLKVLAGFIFATYLIRAAADAGTLAAAEADIVAFGVHLWVMWKLLAVVLLLLVGAWCGTMPPLYECLDRVYDGAYELAEKARHRVRRFRG